MLNATKYYFFKNLCIFLVFSAPIICVWRRVAVCVREGGLEDILLSYLEIKSSYKLHILFYWRINLMHECCKNIIKILFLMFFCNTYSCYFPVSNFLVKITKTEYKFRKNCMHISQHNGKWLVSRWKKFHPLSYPWQEKQNMHKCHPNLPTLQPLFILHAHTHTI